MCRRVVVVNVNDVVNIHRCRETVVMPRFEAVRVTLCIPLYCEGLLLEHCVRGREMVQSGA